jgi:hypothetical protein
MRTGNFHNVKKDLVKISKDENVEYQFKILDPELKVIVNSEEKRLIIGHVLRGNFS